MYCELREYRYSRDRIYSMGLSSKKKKIIYSIFCIYSNKNIPDVVVVVEYKLVYIYGDTYL